MITCRYSSKLAIRSYRERINTLARLLQYKSSLPGTTQNPFGNTNTVFCLSFGADAVAEGEEESSVTGNNGSVFRHTVHLVCNEFMP
jgi:hypothetical protein